ncbi:MAG TPA: alpha/beta hydrolase [Streptosporangiaceae bacterium]
MDWTAPPTTRCTLPVFFSNTSRSPGPKNARLVGVTRRVTTVRTAKFGANMIGPLTWAVRAPVRALVKEAMAAGGPPAAVERFWCYMAGQDGWNRLAPALRERLRAAAGTLFGVELGTYELYLPDDEALAAIAVPVRLLVSEDGLPVFAEIAGRFGQRLGVDVATTPGTHATYHEHPYELAEIVRPFLRQVSGVKS